MGVGELEKNVNFTYFLNTILRGEMLLASV